MIITSIMLCFFLFNFPFKYTYVNVCKIKMYSFGRMWIRNSVGTLEIVASRPRTLLYWFWLLCNICLFQEHRLRVIYYFKICALSSSLYGLQIIFLKVQWSYYFLHLPDSFEDWDRGELVSRLRGLWSNSM